MERTDVIHLHKQASVTLKERKVNSSVIKRWSVLAMLDYLLLMKKIFLFVTNTIYIMVQKHMFYSWCKWCTS